MGTSADTASRPRSGGTFNMNRVTAFLVSALSAFWIPAWAAAPPAPAATPATPSAHAQAPFDLTGYWVSVVTQNWRFRMVVPGRGEYADVPLNLPAKQFADAWNPAADEAAGKQCEAYGAGAIMRVPTRLHISWSDDQSLKVETDAGMQTRLLQFVPDLGEEKTTAAAPSWQGHSVARWIMHHQALTAPPATGGSGGLEVLTDNMLPGLLRKNGVPYGAMSKLTEYWELNTETTDQWLTVTTVLEDPEYLRYPYIVNSIFKKEPDGSKWDPSPCTLRE
jgi:hypothetical protein